MLAEPWLGNLFDEWFLICFKNAKVKSKNSEFIENRVQFIQLS